MYVVVVCIRGGMYGDSIRSSVVMVFVVEEEEGAVGVAVVVVLVLVVVLRDIYVRSRFM